MSDDENNVTELPERDPNGPSLAIVTGDDFVQADYFGFEKIYRVTLPDGHSYFEHKELNEGQKRLYMNAVNRDVVLNQRTNEAKLKTAPGDDRKSLLQAAICGWNLVKNGQPLQFNSKNLAEVLDKFPPSVIDLVERDVRKRNPWMFADMTVEDIRQGITDLEEMLELKLKEEEGNGGSAS